ncbi:MAG: hypothetical protein KGJ23_14550 [Euryarchaeota archaeon]|nr:hypothetical protein [Euryarchaeota archaeon]MDE1837820.1 hypothetical protein [Euryarchaeota archaeon]MDE1880094.1 hypothetical protein [Euryarchaeota archaeon]MDE2045068.1 hypothetical protein [Thermoplasmata archaeon]
MDVWQIPDGEVPGSDTGVSLGMAQVMVSFHLEGVGTPGQRRLAEARVEFSGGT